MAKTVKLTAKQKKFADVYLKCGIATQAALKAGYSNKSAYSQGVRLLKNAKVKEYIDKQNTKVDKKNIADLEEILTELTTMIRDENTSNTDKLKAMDMRLKTLGAYLERIEQKQETTIYVSVDDE